MQYLRPVTLIGGFTLAGLALFVGPGPAQAEAPSLTPAGEAEHPAADNTSLMLASYDPDTHNDRDAKLALTVVNGGTSEPFLQGSWVWNAYASRTFLDDDHGKMTAGHVGAHYYFEDNLSIGLEAVGGYVEPNWDDDSRTQPDEDGVAGALDILLRWHFVKKPGWSLYIDGGVGAQQASTDFPSDSRFNFRDQLGIGATVRAFDNVRVMGGVRYHHHSNASISDNNDGGDWAQPYIGIMVPF